VHGKAVVSEEVDAVKMALFIVLSMLLHHSSALTSEPTFDAPIANVTVVSGQTAVLPCSIENIGKYKVTWLDAGRFIPLTYQDRRVSDDPRFIIDRPSIKEWNLVIREVTWEDHGQYRCTLNTDPVESKIVMLHVTVPALIVDELSSDDVTVQQGGKVELICNVTGVPTPEVTWYRHLQSSSVGERQLIHNSEIFIISNASKYWDGVYECVADNGVLPIATRRMRVTVITQEATSSVCGFKFYSNSSLNGTFTSPNFPDFYPHNTECHYLFYGEPHERVQIMFSYFDVEGLLPECDEETQSDYIEFSNYITEDRRFSHYCGTTAGKSIKSDGSFFRVSFYSNDVYDATGFEASYRFFPGTCVGSCKDVPDGYYISCEGCDKFTECYYDGYMVTKRCPASMVFDAIQKRCTETSSTCF